MTADRPSATDIRDQQGRQDTRRPGHHRPAITHLPVIQLAPNGPYAGSLTGASPVRAAPGRPAGFPLNPAVSLAFALRGDFPWRRAPGYIVIQLTGATLACVFLRWVFGNAGHLGAALPGPGYKPWQALLMEIVLTALLVSVILGTASAAQSVGALAALAVGGYIALAGLWAAQVSGVSMNPARSFGPALVSGDWTSYWVYVAGPATGALIAVGCAFLLRGRGGDVISRAAGSGVLGDGTPAAKPELSEDTEQGRAVAEGIDGPDTQAIADSAK